MILGVFTLNNFVTKNYSNSYYSDGEIQQREKNYLMLVFNEKNFGRRGPNNYDGCYPCLYDRHLDYLIRRPNSMMKIIMNTEILFEDILKLVGKVVAIYEFNDVLNLDDLKKISKYEVKRKI
jgi:hypothetical protein